VWTSYGRQLISSKIQARMEEIGEKIEGKKGPYRAKGAKGAKEIGAPVR